MNIAAVAISACRYASLAAVAIHTPTASLLASQSYASCMLASVKAAISCWHYAYVG